jgi:hypothetical protein
VGWTGDVVWYVDADFSAAVILGKDNMLAACEEVASTEGQRYTRQEFESVQTSARGAERNKGRTSG